MMMNTVRFTKAIIVLLHSAALWFFVAMVLPWEGVSVESVFGIFLTAYGTLSVKRAVDFAQTF